MMQHVQYVVCILLLFCHIIRFQPAEQKLVAHLNCIYFINITVNKLRICSIFEILIGKMQTVHRLCQVIQQGLIIFICLGFLFKKWKQCITSLSVFGLELTETL